MHATIPGSKFDNTTTSYTIPCTTTTILAFTIGGQDFQIDPRDLSFLPVNERNLTGACTSGIIVGSAGVGGPNEWLVRFFTHFPRISGEHRDRVLYGMLTHAFTATGGRCVPQECVLLHQPRCRHYIPCASQLNRTRTIHFETLGCQCMWCLPAKLVTDL